MNDMGFSNVLMFRFEITETNMAAEDAAFCQGHLTVSTGDAEISSRSYQTMMLVASIPDLLDGVRQFVEASEPDLRFYAIDCSFGLRFRQGRDGLISIASGQSTIENIGRIELITGLWAGVEIFLGQDPIKQYMTQYDVELIDVDDPTITTAAGFFYDLTNAVNRFRATFNF